MNGADAYGKTVWSWHPWLMLRLAEIGPAQPGFAKSSIRETTVAKGIRRRGEHGISRQPIAQGMPDCSDCTCMLVCASLRALLHTRPRVQQAPGIPCSLRFEGQGLG